MGSKEVIIIGRFASSLFASPFWFAPPSPWRRTHFQVRAPVSPRLFLPWSRSAFHLEAFSVVAVSIMSAYTTRAKGRRKCFAVDFSCSTRQISRSIRSAGSALAGICLLELGDDLVAVEDEGEREAEDAGEERGRERTCRKPFRAAPGESVAEAKGLSHYRALD